MVHLVLFRCVVVLYIHSYDRKGLEFPTFPSVEGSVK